MEQFSGKGLGFGANIESKKGLNTSIGLENHYIIECYGDDGNIKWVDEFDNIVMEEGVNDSLEQHLKGAAYSASWFVGLMDGAPTIGYQDSLSGHGGWDEVQAYSESQRPELNLGTVGGGSVDNSASKAAFSMSATATAGGAFITNASGKTSTDGVLYGAGAFSGGDRSLQNGDTLNVTITLTAASTS